MIKFKYKLSCRKHFWSLFFLSSAHFLFSITETILLIANYPFQISLLNNQVNAHINCCFPSFLQTIGCSVFHYFCLIISLGELSLSLLQEIQHSFLYQHNISLYGYTGIYLTSSLMMENWIIYKFFIYSAFLINNLYIHCVIHVVCCSFLEK
jgi:hypothetical protein